MKSFIISLLPALLLTWSADGAPSGSPTAERDTLPVAGRHGPDTEHPFLIRRVTLPALQMYPGQESLLQVAPTGYLREVPPLKRTPVRYVRRVKRYRDFWEAIIPEYTKLHFAGGMGLLSFGFGWDYGRKKQWETDLYIGFVPRFSSDRASATFTLKQNYIPWKIPLGGSWSFEPLETGLYFSRVVADGNFWVREPKKYGGPYYRFATSFRANVFLGQRITLGLSRKHFNKSLTFFYELSTCDLYVVSAFTNKYLNVTDILSLAFGLKFQIL